MSLIIAGIIWAVCAGLDIWLLFYVDNQLGYTVTLDKLFKWVIFALVFSPLSLLWDVLEHGHLIKIT